MKRLGWIAFAHVLLVLSPGPGNAGALQLSIAAPANFTGTAVSDTSIQWSWNAVLGSSTTLGATHYELQDENNSPVAVIPGPSSTPVSFTEAGLSPGTMYARHVVAFNGVDVSPPSNDAMATTTQSGPGETVTDCPLKVTLKLLKRVAGKDTIDYEFEVETTVGARCGNSQLRVSARIYGDPKKEKQGEAGGLIVAKPDNSFSKFPKNIALKVGKQTFGPDDGMKARFHRFEIEDGAENIVPGTERFVVNAEIRSGECGCTVAQNLVIPQAKLATAPVGTTTADDNPASSCNPTIVPFYTFLNQKRADVSVTATYKIKLDVKCVPGVIQTVMHAFVTIDGKEKEITDDLTKDPIKTDKVKTPSTIVHHEFKFREKHFETVIENATPGKSKEDRAKIRGSLFFVLNTQLSDACSCLRSLSKEIKGSSKPGPTVSCKLKVNITSVERLLTETNYQVKIEADVIIPRDCAQVIRPGAIGILDVDYTVKVTGTFTNDKGAVEAFTLFTNAPLKGTAEGPGGTDPIVAKAQATVPIPKAALNAAIPNPGYTGDASLKTTVSVAAKDFCGCGAADAKTFASTDVRTGVSNPLEFKPVGPFLACQLGLDANLFLSVSGDTVLLKGASLTTTTPDCVPARLTVTINFSVVGPSGDAQVRRPLTPFKFAPEEKTIETPVGVVLIDISHPVEQIKARIRREFSFTKDAEVDAVFDTLQATYFAVLFDDCGCATSKSLVVTP